MKRLGLVGIASVAVALPFVGGCAVATDLVNPDLLTGLGIDVDTVIPPQGRLIVTFNNTTDQAAQMFVSTSASTTAPELSFETDTILVAAGEARSLAFSCPVGVIAPGNLIAANFGATGVVAVVGAGEGVAEVEQDSAALISGRDFGCGAVIEIRLIQTGGGDDAGFATRVQVIPGR